MQEEARVAAPAEFKIVESVSIFWCTFYVLNTYISLGPDFLFALLHELPFDGLVGLDPGLLAFVRGLHQPASDGDAAKV